MADEKKQPTLEDQYKSTIEERVKRAQETGDIPHRFVYKLGDKTWVLKLPDSVMAQKRLLNLHTKLMIAPTNFDAEKELIEAIAAYTEVDGRPVNVDMLELGELEAMKLAYLDGLLYPLSLGGDKAVLTFMQSIAKTISE